jgi:hypothetical protein
VVELKSDVTDLKTNVNNTALSLQETQKNVNTALESPLAIHYKGITITPGGFLAAEFVRRSRALGIRYQHALQLSDHAGSFAKQPFRSSSDRDVSRVSRC